MNGSAALWRPRVRHYAYLHGAYLTVYTVTYAPRGEVYTTATRTFIAPDDVPDAGPLPTLARPPRPRAPPYVVPALPPVRSSRRFTWAPAQRFAHRS